MQMLDLSLLQALDSLFHILSSILLPLWKADAEYVCHSQMLQFPYSNYFLPKSS